jgi:hypothetical protein
VTHRPEDKAVQTPDGLLCPTICQLCDGLDIIGWNAQPYRKKSRNINSTIKSTIYASALLSDFGAKVRRSMNSQSTLIASTIMSPEQIGRRRVNGGPYFASRFQNRIGTFSK